MDKKFALVEFSIRKNNILLMDSSDEDINKDLSRGRVNNTIKKNMEISKKMSKDAININNSNNKVIFLKYLTFNIYFQNTKNTFGLKKQQTKSKPKFNSTNKFKK